MNYLTVDVAVIGAGSAGLAAYRAARAQGARAVLIERGPHGTTCARVGCMPSKLLIAAAAAAHQVTDAAGFGIHAGDVRIDGRQVMARVRAERDRFVDFVLAGEAQIPAADRLSGSAKFIGPQQLQVDQHTQISAARIVLATGSQPIIPDELSGLGACVVTSDQLFDMTDLPASIAVIGSGAIGLELGQALHRLGVRTALFNRDERLGPLTDPAVLSNAITCIGAELDLRLAYQQLDVQREGAGAAVHSIDKDGVARSEHFAMVLVAVGRRPNLQTLQLDRSGLTLDAHGVPDFDPHTMQCGSSYVFIAGDANDEIPLLHEAVDQGQIAGDNAARFPAIALGLRHSPLGVVFCEPQIAMVGQRFSDLQTGTFAIGSVDFATQGRSRVLRQNRGLLRVYGELGSKHFLGAEMVGPSAEHLAHLLAWACQQKMTVAQMLQMPFYHPVIEEGVRTALRELQDRLEASDAQGMHCDACTPGR